MEKGCLQGLLPSHTWKSQILSRYNAGDTQHLCQRQAGACLWASATSEPPGRPAGEDMEKGWLGPQWTRMSQSGGVCVLSPELPSSRVVGAPTGTSGCHGEAAGSRHCPTPRLCTWHGGSPAGSQPVGAPSLGTPCWHLSAGSAAPTGLLCCSHCSPSSLLPLPTRQTSEAACR